VYGLVPLSPDQNEHSVFEKSGDQGGGVLAAHYVGCDRNWSSIISGLSVCI
jgi:hypothetical protein